MEQTVLKFEPVIRLGFFIGFLLLISILESKTTWREVLTPRSTRWQRNFGILAISTACVRALFYSTMTLVVALEVAKLNIGLFNMPEFRFLPYLWQVVLGVLLLDLIIYLQHRAFHRIHLGWRMHRVHHTDKELELSTGLRFHPLEMIVSMAIKILGIAFIGAPLMAVLMFEILLNAFAMFTHANIKLPEKLEPIIRWVFVTPNMHRIHHSDIPEEHDSNFGTLFSFWDRIFSTYTHTPQMGERKMVLGLETFQAKKHQTLKEMLLNPFEKPKKTRKRKKKTHMQSPEPKAAKK